MHAGIHPPTRDNPLPLRPPTRETPYQGDPTSMPRRPPTKETPLSRRSPSLQGDPPCQGDPLQAHTQGEIEGDQVQAHTQWGNRGGSDPGPHPRGKFRGNRTRPPTPRQLLLRVVRILLECILVLLCFTGMKFNCIVGYFLRL